jgi:IS5 family transposase
MIIDRYDPVNLSQLVPRLSLEMEPVLTELDRLLEDDELFQRVKGDLSRRYPKSATLGRHSTPVEVILRMLVVRRLYNWSYEETEHFVSDSLVLRQFCRLYLEPAPDDTTLLRWAGLIGPDTLDQLNDHIVLLARQLKVTKGRKLRTDGTVVEANIHHPTDNSLLSDGVRVISRLIRKAKKLIGESRQGTNSLFRDRTRSAKRLDRQIVQAARHRGEAGEIARRITYEKLLGIVQASLRQARLVRERLVSITDKSAQQLVGEVDHFIPLVQQVICQTQRRVLEGVAVPAGEKVVSLFEPHTCIIRRGKVGKETEFGRKVWLDEVDGGIISNYRILEGNPADGTQAVPSLAGHQRLFGHPPHLFAGDRGIYSRGNETVAQDMGVKRVALPKPGSKSPERRQYERQGWFRRAGRFRAGSEGRISVLKRRGYLGRCRDRGEAGFGRWVGWGILTANLTTIARTVTARS